MMRQFCRACGNEVFSNGTLPLGFCTNCGAQLPRQNQGYAPNYGSAPPQGSKGSVKLTGREKFGFGVLIAIPLILILAGIGTVAMFVYFASKRTEPVGRYPNPRPYASPSPQKPQNQLLSFGGEGLGQGEFKNPESLAVDKDGNIYVGDGTLRIQKFDAKGKFVMLWNVTESAVKADEKYWNAVTNLAVDSKNRVYAVVGGGEILRYDGATGKFIDKIALYGEKWMNQPQKASVMDMVMLNDDNLVILAASFPEGEYIIKVSPEGKTEITQKDLMKKQNPNSIRLSQGSMLVSVTGEIFLMNNSPTTEKTFLYRFKPDGSYVDRFTWDGAPTISIFNGKIVALSSKGEVYAYSQGKKTISVLNVEGVPLRNIPVGSDYVRRMVLDANDNIYILSRNQIEKYSTASVE